jgi:hypothetical protein
MQIDAVVASTKVVCLKIERIRSVPRYQDLVRRRRTPAVS